MEATFLALGSRGRAEERRAGSGGKTAPRCAGWWRIRTIETPDVTHLSDRIATTDKPGEPELELVRMLEAPGTIHIRYRVVK
jgi:hypothetical protein